MSKAFAFVGAMVIIVVVSLALAALAVPIALWNLMTTAAQGPSTPVHLSRVGER